MKILIILWELNGFYLYLTMARLMMDDLPTSVAFELRVSIEMELVFKKIVACASESGNFTSSDPLAWDNPQIVAP